MGEYHQRCLLSFYSDYCGERIFHLSVFFTLTLCTTKKHNIELMFKIVLLYCIS